MENIMEFMGANKECLALLGIAIGSEIVGISGLKSNSIVQLIWSAIKGALSKKGATNK